MLSLKVAGQSPEPLTRGSVGLFLGLRWMNFSCVVLTSLGRFIQNQTLAPEVCLAAGFLHSPKGGGLGWGGGRAVSASQVWAQLALGILT